MNRLLIALALALLGSVFVVSPAKAACTDGDMIDVVGDPAWQCIFPITISSFTIDSGDHPDSETSSEFICQCEGKGIFGQGYGLPVGFWEPARMIETTYNPGCFPGLGMEIDMSSGSGYQGPGGYTSGGTGEKGRAFQHYHYYIMPLWALLDLFTDIPCLSDETQFDLVMMSEFRPDWNDDLYALQLFPEVALTANKAAVMACAVDAIAATVARPIDAMYWCMGSWETTFPPTGNVMGRDYVKANAAIAGRAMYLQARTALLPDRAVNQCSTTYLPTWIKSHWRIQEIDPKVDSKCHNIGEAGILWTHRKNPAGAQDNFSWLLFRKVDCCAVFGI